MDASASRPVFVAGRYSIQDEFAAGGMATVHIGRLLGPAGFTRTVAIKRLHPQFAKDPEFAAMLLDEARLAARIRHPNVVPTIDVVATGDELFVVMEYVQGESLSKLSAAMRARGAPIPPRIVVSILFGALHGLHAAHEARSEQGEPLGIVHRDVSPQNILVGVDGVARLLDFGVAKAAGRLQTTRDGQIKGKLAYMAPEQIGGEVSRCTDIFAASIVLWESLTGARLFAGEHEGETLGKLLSASVDPPSARLRRDGARLDADTARSLAALDAVTLRGLDRDPSKRFATAREMALALEQCLTMASSTAVGEWVETIAATALSKRAQRLAAIESAPSDAAQSRPAERPPTSRRRARGVVAAVLVASVIAGAFALSKSIASDELAAASSASVSSAVAPPALSAAATASVEPTRQPAAPTLARSDAPPTKKPAVAPLVAPIAPTATVPRASCNPPFTVDSAGRKHYRAECL